MDLMRVLLARGHELHCAIRPASPLPTQLGELPIQWHEVKLRNAVDWFSIRRLRKIIAENQIEVVHAHLARDYPIVGMATKASPARFFLTRHHFNPLKANPLYEAALNHATNLLAVSASVREALAQAFPTLEDRIRIIPNWLDERTLTPVSRKEARAFFGIRKYWAVAVIGQLTPLKRQDLFLAAIQQLTANGAYERADFFVIGAANPEDRGYETKLKTMAREMGLADRIHFTGAVEDLPRYLPAFDIVVAPSENEGFSLVTIEAMAAGCAVIATEVGGMAEIIEPNITGILFQPDNAEMLAQELRCLLFDNQSRQKIAEAAQTMARARYDRQQIVAQIERLYQANDIGER